MIGKIVNSTKGKPCSCPTHKSCTGCIKKYVRPQVYIRNENTLPLPIKITHYKVKKPAVHFKEKKTLTKYKEKNGKKESKQKEKEKQYEENSQIQKEKPLYPSSRYKPKGIKEKIYQLCNEERKEEKTNKDKPISLFKGEPVIYPSIEEKSNSIEYKYLENPRRTSSLSEWYRRQRAIKELKAYYKQENKKEKREWVEREKVRRLKEEELLRQLQEPKPKLASKKKQVYAKPQVNLRNRYEDISNKFVNCCYRVCCQLYCWLTCILIIGVAFILLI